MSQFGWENCPPGVRQQIECLINDLRRRLGENLIGVYLHGSLATGCFNPARSDLDLLVATRQRTNIDTKHDLARLLLAASRRPAPIEISFLSENDLRPWRHPTPFDFHYSEDWRKKFESELADGKWKNWNAAAPFDDDLAAHVTVLNHRGACLFGEPIRKVFPAVPERDFLDSIVGDVLSPQFGLGSAMQYPVYAVLNACRTLAFLRTRRVLSKEEGGKWALENLPAEFRRTISGALDEYRHNRHDRSDLPAENLARFAAFMKNEIERT
jgi:streptomycin 3"-adenylyltransferase